MGTTNLYRSVDDVRRDCVERAQSLAGPPQFAVVAAGGGAASGQQLSAAGEMSSGDVQSAPDAAPPAEFEPCGDALGVADAPPQIAPALPQPGGGPRHAGGAHSLAADFGGMTGRQGRAELRRMAAALQVRKHAGQTNAQLKEACQRAVASQVTLGRFVRIPAQAPAPM